MLKSILPAITHSLCKNISAYIFTFQIEDVEVDENEIPLNTDESNSEFHENFAHAVEALGPSEIYCFFKYEVLPDLEIMDFLTKNKKSKTMSLLCKNHMH